MITIYKRRLSVVYVILVLGCADVSAPANAWHKREGNVATVGCHHHNKTWHLKCEGNQWNGVVGNCKSKGDHPNNLLYELYMHQCYYRHLSVIINCFIIFQRKLEVKRRERVGQFLQMVNILTF